MRNMRNLTMLAANPVPGAATYAGEAVPTPVAAPTAAPELPANAWQFSFERKSWTW